MSLKCEICGKGVLVGYNVSHARNRTKKKSKPNLRRIKLTIDGTTRRVRICAQCLKSTKLETSED